MDVLQFNALGVVPVALQVQKILDHLSHSHSAQSITIMVHGYLFNYGDKIHCPHSTLFHPNKIDHRATSPNSGQRFQMMFQLNPSLNWKFNSNIYNKQMYREPKFPFFSYLFDKKKNIV